MIPTDMNGFAARLCESPPVSHQFYQLPILFPELKSSLDLGKHGKLESVILKTQHRQNQNKNKDATLDKS